MLLYVIFVASITSIQKFTWICGDDLNVCWLQLYDMADGGVQKMEKYKEGTHARVRILGFRNLEGLAMGTLKVILSTKICILRLAF